MYLRVFLCNSVTGVWSTLEERSYLSEGCSSPMVKFHPDFAPPRPSHPPVLHYITRVLDGGWGKVVLEVDPQKRGVGIKALVLLSNSHSFPDTGRMQLDLLWITAALLASGPVLTLCAPLNVMSAPNLLRVGTTEKVFVEAQDYTGGDIPVRVVVKNHPQKNIELASKHVLLSANNNFQELVDIKIMENKDAFSEDPLEKQYVYLEAHFPTSVLEKVVMVSFQSGYIFVQTDKSIYTPQSTVKYRIFSVTPDLQPLDQNGISIEIINPQGIILHRDLFFPKQGILTGTYDIPDVASPGIWSIATRFKNTPQKNFTAEFEVKEYVLPTFEVTLRPAKSFFYVDDDKLEVDIYAQYLFGSKVDGIAFVVFGVIQGDSKTSLAASLRRVSITEGEGKAELTREMILKTFKSMDDLVGSSLYISVSVLTETGSEMVEAQRRGIQIVTSPYTIHFKRTPKFFKPGMPFDVTVYVTNPDDTPAERVDVVVSPGDVLGRTESNGMARVTVNTAVGSKSLTITVKTKDPGLTPARQDEKQFIAEAYATKGGSKNYLHVGVDAGELTVGMSLKVTLNYGASPGVQNSQDFTSLILSKGQIVQAKRFKRDGQSLVAQSILVTKDMLPSFRVVAYYHVGASEVVADSVWVDVKDTCMGTLKVETRIKKATYEPGESFSLSITGDPGAKVGLVAVDKGVFVLNKNRLTQSKIWDIIEKHDTGCTAGSGKDSMGVFYDAGLVFHSDKADGTTERTTKACPTPTKRKRRAETAIQVSQTLSSKYSGELKKCCADGLRKNKLGYTCERRATFITDGPECVQAFKHCCEEMQKRRVEDGEGEMLLARSEEDDDLYVTSDEIVSRTQFPESWLWEDRDMPSCKKSPCPSTNLVMENKYLKDSITTWQVLAISLSKTHGICVADPFEMIVRKDFFVDLKLPYSAVRNEQLEIKAVLHNFSSKKHEKVRVEFIETRDVCSAASKKGKYRTTVSVDAMSSRSISYVIIPMKLGDFDIEVKAAAINSGHADGVKKKLKVVSEGVLTTVEEVNVELNPSKNPGGVQEVNVKSDIPKGQIPNTPAHTYITVAGQEVSQTIEQAISGDFMGRLIVQPHGCGEQTMIYMTLPLIATHYLDTTKQWEAVGMQRRAEAIKHIQTGYQRELTYRKPEGSYAAWTDRQGSTWLTAYVSKVFAIASSLIAIDEKVLCGSLKWLVLKTQMPDGMFREDAPVIHGEMVGDVRGKDADASLTAFVLIAMQEGHELCANLVPSLPESMNKAIEYLGRRIPTMTNPYAIAMTSYAMANAGKLDKDLLMKFSSGDGSYWQVSGGHHFTLEASAYALLALVKVKDFEAAGKVVHWLNRQTSPYGSSGTTQATIMVFQAVAEYYKQVKTLQDAELDVAVAISGRTKTNRWVFKRETPLLSRSDKVQLKQEFNVTAKGTGVGSLKVTTLYYARPIERESDCKLFNLSVSMKRLRQVTYQGAKESYELTIETFYKNPKEKRDATMSILDIGLLTGFVVDELDLAELTTGKERYIQKFEMDKQLSERGSLILYLDKVSHEEVDRFVFRVHKITEVAMLQPASVSVYEYYAPGERCVKYYHPLKKDGTLDRLCSSQDGLCQCAEENCSIQKKEKIDEQERSDKACEVGMDYVYKVKLQSSKKTPYSDFYDMKIEQVLKEGSETGVEGQVRSFMGHSNCRESFGFEDGKSYLIMGRSADLPKIDKRLQYILGEQTWIEYWPTSEEGQSSEFEDQYLGIQDLTQKLINFGCPT
uniref:Complement C3a, tandem duplicate 2 n=1 Tax=Astyanax mexicanus TaxID=7994 RepID=W5LK65_ASTMX